MESDSCGARHTTLAEIGFSTGSNIECRQIQTYDEMRLTDHPHGVDLGTINSSEMILGRKY